MTERAPDTDRPIEDLDRRLGEAGYEHSVHLRVIRYRDGRIGRRKILDVEWPNGRTTRRVTFDASDAAAVLEVNFERFRILGEYDAIVDIESGMIEARIANASRATMLRNNLRRIPGVVRDASSEDDWRLVVESGEIHIECSPATDDFNAMFAGGKWTAWETIKISGVGSADQQDSLRVLEGLANSFLFDLDLRYRTGLVLARRQPRLARTRDPQIEAPPSFPTNKYSAEALELYFYGRAASGLPLLEFLAYYQCVEFFLPGIVQEETVRRVASALRDPRFDVTNDNDIRRMIAIATSSASAGRGLSEKEQLRIAVRSLLDADQIREHLESEERIKEHFCSQTQSIKGVSRIILKEPQRDLRDQIADRIYGIRNRIVHTKEDGGGSSIDLLLPSGKETRSLGPDVDLVRVVAETALVARASPLSH